MIYCSYATLNSPYITVLKTNLLPSLEKFNLPYDIAYPENGGSWQINTSMKANIIQDMLLKHKQPIIFLDADATIEQPPILFDTLECDIALHYLDYNYFWKGLIGLPERHALSGTLYINYNDSVISFVNSWLEENKKFPMLLEQQNMQNVLNRFKDRLNIFNLPIEYAAIIKYDNKIPSYIKDLVIVHHQASREYKKRKYYEKL